MYSTTISIPILLLTLSILASSVYYPFNMNGNNNPVSAPDELRISCWNSRGLVAALPYLHKIMGNSDVVALSEHWLHSNRLNVLQELSDDFHVIARSSKYAEAGTYGSTRGQGGVAVLWRKTLTCVTPISEIVHDRVCGVRVPLKNGTTLSIYSVYLPSKGSPEDFRTVIDEVYDLVYTETPNNLCILCGDFNGDVGFLGGKRSNRPPTNQGGIVANLFDELSLFPVNLDIIAEGPVNTFRGGMGSSTLDYIAIPESLRYCLNSCRVTDDVILNTSDHLAIKATLKVPIGKHNKAKIHTSTRILWGKANSRGLTQVYRESIYQSVQSIYRKWALEMCSHDEIDSIFDSLTKEILKASETLPKACRRFHARPYWNQTLNALKKVKVVAHRAWKANGSVRDALNPFWQEYKLTKKNFRREIKRVQREFE